MMSAGKCISYLEPFFSVIMGVMRSRSRLGFPNNFQNATGKVGKGEEQARRKIWRGWRVSSLINPCCISDKLAELHAAPAGGGSLDRKTYSDVHCKIVMLLV